MDRHCDLKAQEYFLSSFVMFYLLLLLLVGSYVSVIRMVCHSYMGVCKCPKGLR